MSDRSEKTQAQQLAKTIMDDLRGAGYYADPKTLADMIRRGANTGSDDERNAVEIIRLLLRMYSTGTPQQDQVEKRLADLLESMGVR
jgi:hypothetical protein